MSAFAVTLDRLLSQLDRLESTASSPPAARSAHVERATIRLRRAYAALQDAGPRAPVELLIRLKGRAQEVEQALVDSDSAPPHHDAQLARELATQVVQQIEQHLAVAMTESDSGSGGGGGHHSRTPSTSDLPRRVPHSSKSTTETTTTPDLDAVQRRAQALSDCYTLARLAKSGVVPSAKPLSALLRLAGGDNHSTVASEGATQSRERDLEAQIKAQLRRAYFDSFRPLFQPAQNGASAAEQRRAAAWTRLAQDLVDAVVPLIPPRMSADPALYPNSAAAAAVAAADRTSMRAAVERDLLSTATTTTTVHAAEEECLPKLERLVRVLQRLCAPARDPDVRAILDKLQSGAAATHAGTTAFPAENSGDRTASAATAAAAPPHHAPPSHSSDLLLLPSTTSPSPSHSQSQSQQQPDWVVDLVREILDLAEAMRADLDRFHTELKKKKNKAIATSTTSATLSEEEEELGRVVIEREAAMRERAVVIEWYGGREENVRRATRRWCLERSAGAGADRSGVAAPESSASSAAAAAAADPTTSFDRVVSREEFAVALVESLFASQPVAVPSLEETPPLSPPPPPVDAPLSATSAAAASEEESKGNDKNNQNLLPPPLVVLAPLLFELQNQLQALVILACLATIASSSSSAVNSPPPRPAAAAAAAADTSTLLERLWTILDMNITRRPASAGEERIVVPGLDQTSAAAKGPSAASSVEDKEEEDGTRLAHLADEILAHLTTAAAATSQDPPPPPPPSIDRAAHRDPDLEKRVRASVDRILRYEDPVWKLFSNRLERAVQAALLDSIRSSNDDAITEPSAADQVHPRRVPAQLRTGRFATSSSSAADERRRRRGPALPLRTGGERRAADLVAETKPVKVKGFEQPAFLADKVSELVRDRLVGEVWTHVEEVWGTILGWGEIS